MLTELGVYKLWHEDPDTAWRWTRPWFRLVMEAIAPSYGYGIDRIPASGGGVIVANHLSAIDPPLVAMFSSRTMYYMAKAELLDVPVIGRAHV